MVTQYEKEVEHKYDICLKKGLSKPHGHMCVATTHALYPRWSVFDPILRLQPNDHCYTILRVNIIDGSRLI